MALASDMIVFACCVCSFNLIIRTSDLQADREAVLSEYKLEREKTDSAVAVQKKLLDELSRAIKALHREVCRGL